MGGIIILAIIKVASIFSGCGGMDLGMLGGFNFINKKYSKNPIEIIYALDNDKYVCDIFNANFELKCVNEDIRNIDIKKIPTHNILTGGFPCTSFSIVAQNPPRLGYKDDKGRLFFEMCKVLMEKQPECFIAENVPGILSANERQAFPLILDKFREASYYLKYKILDASDFGVPQRRRRIFIIGFIDKEKINNFDFPEPVMGKKVPLSKVLIPEEEIKEKYYFSERAIRGLEKARKRKSHMDVGRPQNIDDVCNTVGAHLAKISLNSTDPVLYINGRYRRFTPREVARIQSFPDDFILIGSETRQYRALGNAVPPVLMWHVTKNVIDVMNN